MDVENQATSEKKQIWPPPPIDIIGGSLLGKWEIPDAIDDSEFDYTWEPSPLDPPYIHQFGTQWQKTGGPRYVVPGATEIKYVSVLLVKKLSKDPHWQIPPDVDASTFDFTWHPDETEHPYIYQFGTQWQKTGGPRYVVPGATTIKYVSLPHIVKTTIDPHWQIPPDVDVSEFDFTWHPDETDQPYIYQFGTQWQKTGGPRYVVPGASGVKYVSVQHAKKNTVDLCWKIPPDVDASTFDFTWHPDETEHPYIYQFGTQWQKTGGPRYVVSGATRIKYSDAQTITRLPQPNLDNWGTLVSDLQVDWSWHPDETDPPCVYIFGAGSKTGAQHPAVRYRVGDSVRHKYMDITIAQYQPLDVIFMSNGETCAEENWQKLVELLKDKPNRLVRSDGVIGRTASQHAAANLSTTSWYFQVPAKLEVNPHFDWNWQPDRSEQPKHYVFTATNPLNGLEYGHQAMIGQNRDLTFNSKGRDLDFTMESPLEIVKINSGIARYNTSAYETWRTAFREVVKLTARTIVYPNDQEAQERLRVWKTCATGNWSDMSIQGAIDGYDYYHSVDGNHDELMKSSDWQWLKSYYHKIHA